MEIHTEQVQSGRVLSCIIVKHLEIGHELDQRRVELVNTTVWQWDSILGKHGKHDPGE